VRDRSTVISPGSGSALASTKVGALPAPGVEAAEGGRLNGMSEPANGHGLFRIDGVRNVAVSTEIPLESSEGRDFGGGFGLNASTRPRAPLPAGSHTFSLVCTESPGSPDVRFDTYISTLAIGGTPRRPSASAARCPQFPLGLVCGA
jgi:hypothetical protein